MEELVDNIFASYDADGDGTISKEEMRDCMEKSVYMAGYDRDSPMVQKMIDQRISELVAACDADGDGKITKAELIEATKKNPDLLSNW